MKRIYLTLLLLFSILSVYATDIQLRSKISNGNDDVEVYNAYKNFASNDLELGGYDAGRVYIALRFQNITIPSNAKISKAYIQFTTKNTQSKAAKIDIKCQLGNASAYNTFENIKLRPYVAKTISWSTSAWKTAYESGSNQKTPDLKEQITAAIASGWQSGNALSFTLEGNAGETNINNACSYESYANHAGVAELIIEYAPTTTPIPTPTGIVRNIKITNGNDDVEVYSNSKNFTSIDLELGGYDAGRVYVGTRFQNVNIPAGANVTKAYIQFTSYNKKDKTTDINIKCQKGNAAAYGTSENLLSRAYVSNVINWKPSAWKNQNERGSNQRTPDLSAAIKAAVASGWQSGNALSFIFQGNANEVDVINATSYESYPDHSGVAELVIEYIDGCLVDNEKPVFANCPADINLTTTGTSATATWTAPTVSDNCTSGITPSVTSAPTAGLNKGSAFPIGTTTVTYTAKDAKGNTATCSFRVIVSKTDPCATDNVKPTFSGCPSNISLTTTGTSATATWTAPTVSDNCTSGIIPTITTSPTAGLNRGSAFPVGTTTVTYTAKDAKGNTATCTFTVTISKTDPCATDNVNPTFSGCPSSFNLVTTGTTATATWTAPTVSDNCTSGITPTITTSPTAGLNRGSAFPVGTTTVTYTAKDAKGNTAICTFTVTISKTDPCATDNVNPTFSGCPSSFNLLTTGTTATANWTAPTVSDNCTSGITPTIATAPTAGLNSGSAFPIGTTTITYTAKDAKGNTTTCSFTVTVAKTDPCATDNVKPTFSNCPSNISLTTTGTTATATWTAPTVSDNCTANITPSVTTSPTAGLNSGSAFPVGTTTVTYTATDAKGNSATCSFTVTVTKSTPPPPTDDLFINEVAPQGTISEKEDWIELYNNGTATVALDDVYMSNTTATPFKAKLTGLSIPAKGFLFLFADNEPLKGSNHLNFKVSAKGEKLYVYRDVNGTAVLLSSFETPSSPPEEDNVTFGGLVEGQPAPAPSALTKFLGGTPKAANAGGIRYVKITNSLARGIVSANSSVTLSAPAGMTISYTTDNSFPSRTNGTIYSQPITITNTVVLKTLVYNSNSESKVEAFTYIIPVKGAELLYPDFVSQVDYESGLKQIPIVSLSSNLDAIDSQTEKQISFEYINKFGENASIGVIAGARSYGNFSLQSPQRNIRVAFKNKYGYSNLEYPVYSREDVDTYKPTDKFDALNLKIGQDGPSQGGFAKLMTSQQLVSKTMRELGNIDLHGRYAHAFVNGKYHGIYTLTEFWNENFAETYYGGSDKAYDQIEEGANYRAGTINLNQSGEPQGTLTNWNAMLSASNRKNFQGVKRYLNVKQYIDYQLLNMYFDYQWEYRAFADTALLRTKFVFENHDTDGALTKTLNDDVNAHDLKWQTTGGYEAIFEGPAGVMGNLYNTNKEFKTLVRDRVYEAMQKPNGALTVNRITAKLNELKSVIRPIYTMELARFNSEGTVYDPTWDQELDITLKYLPTRFQFTLDKWREKDLVHTLVPVTFSQPSGTITSPVTVANPNNVGVVYYTIDGSDPMGNDGVISPTAKLYTNQLALNAGSNKVVARVYLDSDFGPPASATYTTSTAISALQVAQFLDANGKIEGSKAVLNWVTKTASGPDYFKIEKLNNQGKFEVIETINANYSNNANGVENYITYDNSLKEGSNTYRIALYSDLLNTPQYSSNIELKYGNFKEYTLSPNPTSDFVDMDLKAFEGDATTITIFNSIGKPVLVQKFDKTAPLTRLDVEKLDVGQYFISIQAQGKRGSIKKLSIVR